eukprot:CAMPEP_0180835244 /NCGR_PEP_ID=MMETSP1038_2-20121128/78269_1 /TAXON_ID=632150 /ORGANISM="Azadinium spinosum, Strain 3D9" /LENGTH=242 /DNA_ID=CAMNT_0022878497 /DNA_START=15 /DNA_END=744 /DNA_ORIENTATION=-
MAKEGLGDVKILIWDHNRDGMLERAAWGRTLRVVAAAEQVEFQDRQSGARPIHEIRSRLGFDNVRKVADLAPEKHLLFSEGCQELAERKLAELLGDWFVGERYAMNIINDLDAGTEAWIDWNLILDEEGGPNHVGNNCVAPIICDTRTDDILIQPAFYYLGHFSKYIKKGARKVLSSTSRDAVEILSFKNPDGSLVLVVMNRTFVRLNFWIKIQGLPGKACAVHDFAPPRSISTFVADDGEP